MIDTLNDVVIGDIGDEIVNTGGVAVRPFWWSTECLVALGLATGDGTTGTTGAGDTSDTGSGGSGETTSGQGGTGSQGGTGGGSGEGDASGDVEALADGGLSGGWIALIAVLAAVAVAALVILAFVLGRGRRGGTDTTTGAGADGAPATAVAAGVAAQEFRTTPAFCSECGGTLAPGARFCPGCGRRLQ